MKRFLALALSFAMILGVLLMAGCDGDTDTSASSNTSASTSASTTESTSASTSDTTASTNDTTSASTNDTTDSTDGSTDASTDGTTESTSASTEDTSIDDGGEIDPYSKPNGFEHVEFGGKEFVIAATSGPDDRWFTTKEIYVEEAATQIDQAVNERNRTIEKLYNCTITLIPSETVGTLVEADVTSSREYIHMYSSTAGNAKGSGEGGNVYNLFDLGIDFSNEWWDQTYVNTYTVNTSNGNPTIFGLMGDFCLTSFSATHAILYNKDVYESAGIQYDLEQLVRDKEWTMDIFQEMIVKAAKDDGDQTWSYDGTDILGWGRTGHATHGMHVASGLSIIANNNGTLVFEPSSESEQWVSIIEKAINIYATPGALDIGYTNVQDGLQSKRVLFGSEVIDVLERMKDVTDLRVGVVPYPLYSSTQENYAHYVDNHLFAYYVPVSVGSVTTLEQMGEFIEVFGFHSRYIVRAAFVDVYSTDYAPGSPDMLEIILDSRTYDPGYLYWSALEGYLSGFISGGKNQVAMFANSKAGSANGDITTHVTKITEKHGN